MLYKTHFIKIQLKPFTCSPHFTGNIYRFKAFQFILGNPNILTTLHKLKPAKDV
jgi:hypothetical protein